MQGVEMPDRRDRRSVALKSQGIAVCAVRMSKRSSSALSMPSSFASPSRKPAMALWSASACTATTRVSPLVRTRAIREPPGETATCSIDGSRP